jgi:hypothetical protein
VRWTGIARLAAFGLLVSVFQSTIAAIALALGVFQPLGPRLELRDPPAAAASACAADCWHAVQQASHSAFVAVDEIVRMGHGLALRSLLTGGAALLLFGAILLLEWRRAVAASRAA